MRSRVIELLMTHMNVGGKCGSLGLKRYIRSYKELVPADQLVVISS